MWLQKSWRKTVSEFYYFDTSALIKRYVRESGSAVVKRLFSKKARIFTSRLTYAEAHATFHRLHRDGYIDKSGLTGLSRQFESDWKKMHVIDVTATVTGRIPDLLHQATLRGADAVQLSSAAGLKTAGFNPVFVCADVRLLTAAKTVGLRILQPQ